MRDSPTAPAASVVLPSPMNLPQPNGASSPSSYHTRRLFVGDIPKNIKAEAAKELVKGYFPEASKVEVYPDLSFGNRNRGFAFVEWESHDQAAIYRERMRANPPEVNGRRITCDWAQVENTVSDEVMRTVKVLFIRNVHPTLTEDLLLNFCGGKEAGVEKVKIQRMHAFVHFSSRRQAALKKEEIDGADLCGLRLEVSWSKPKARSHPYAPSSVLHPPQPPLPLDSLQLLRLPDAVVPGISSVDSLLVRPGLLQILQNITSCCQKILVPLPLFSLEIYYLPLNGITTFRSIATFLNGLRVEGEFHVDPSIAEETTLNNVLALLNSLTKTA